jgi:dienelactone hydrolase
MKVYISKPNDYPHQPSKLLLLLTGGTGMHSRNNQIQSDKFASEGFLVVMPDMFDGDYAPNSSTAIEERDLTMIEQIKLGIADVVKSFNLDMWIARQTPEKVLPILYKVLEGAREEFADAVASGGGIYGVGYCLGGRFLLQLASEKPAILLEAQKVADEEAGLVKNGPHIKAGAIAHAALVTKEDFEGLKPPMLLVCVENDQLFSQETLNGAETYLKVHTIEHEIKIFPGVPHGQF